MFSIVDYLTQVKCSWPDLIPQGLFFSRLCNVPIRLRQVRLPLFCQPPNHIGS